MENRTGVQVRSYRDGRMCCAACGISDSVSAFRVRCNVVSYLDAVSSAATDVTVDCSHQWYGDESNLKTISKTEEV